MIKTSHETSKWPTRQCVCVYCDGRMYARTPCMKIMTTYSAIGAWWVNTYLKFICKELSILRWTRILLWWHFNGISTTAIIVKKSLQTVSILEVSLQLFNFLPATTKITAPCIAWARTSLDIRQKLAPFKSYPQVNCRVINKELHFFICFTKLISLDWIFLCLKPQ